MFASHRTPYLLVRAWLIVFGLCSGVVAQATPEGEKLLDESAITAAAAGLASSTRHNWASADQLATLLIDYDKSRPLPAQAMTHLYDAVERAPGMNAAYAVQVLQSIPVGDQRFERNVAALTAALHHEWDYVREKAAIALAHYGSQGALPAGTIAVLTGSATADPTVGVRIESFTALATQALADIAPLTTSLMQELAHPTREMWKAYKGRQGYHELMPRAIALLMDWLAPPYPELAMDALIVQTRQHYVTTLPYLETIGTTHTWTEAQRKNLESLAERNTQEMYRQRLYSVLAGGTPVASDSGTLTDFQPERSRTTQLKAAYQLERQYSGQVIPADIAAAAQRVLLQSEHRDARTVAARLLAASDIPVAEQEQVYLQALRENASDSDVAVAWLTLYEDEQVPALVVRHLGNPSLSAWTRANLAARLANLLRSGLVLDKATRTALVDVGSSTRHYNLNYAVVDALEAADLDIPLSVKLRNKPFLSAWLGGVYVVAAILFVVGSGANLVIALSVPFQGTGAKAAKRTGLLSLWFVITVVGLALFGIAMIGFLGHNSAPDPRYSVKFNIPMYFGMLVFLLYTVGNIAWARRRSAAQKN